LVLSINAESNQAKLLVTNNPIICMINNDPKNYGGVPDNSVVWHTTKEFHFLEKVLWRTTTITGGN